MAPPTPSIPVQVTTGAAVRESEAGAILDRAAELLGMETIGLQGKDSLSAVVIPKGRELRSLKPLIDEYRDRPERKKGTAILTTVTSFVEHVNRHRDGNTVVFANDDRTAPSFLAVFDYNEAGAVGQPRFGQHRAAYAFPVSGEWKAWVVGGDQPMNQAAFAEFLEDRIGDVLEPGSVGERVERFAIDLGIELVGAQTLMTLARGLTVKVGQTVKQAVSLSSGEASIAFEETHGGADGAPVRVPGGFALAIPVFHGGPLYQVPVRLRYRVQGGAVTWRFVPHRTDLVFKHAFDEAVEEVRKGTELTVFYGRPEA